jgi:hypothetical protein
VVFGQLGRVVAAARGGHGETDAEVDTHPAPGVDVLRAARRLERPQPASTALPEQIPKPTLRHIGEVDMAGTPLVANAEVLRLQESDRMTPQGCMA